MVSDPLAVLRAALGYPGFRPGQEELVRAVLAGRDALGVLPTGGGKSVCYQVPALILDGLTLVISPLVSLMEDQAGRATSIGLQAEYLSGTQPASDRQAALRRVRQGHCDILFVSPERLEVSSFITVLRSIRLALIAVDEAHCISEWGHDFRPSYRRIGWHLSAWDTPTLALTASATPDVRSDICENLSLREPLEVVRSFDRPNLWWSVQAGGAPHERLKAIADTVSTEGGCTIVYAPTRRAVELIRDHLASRGVRCDAYHAGMTGSERSRVQSRFMEGSRRVVVATNAFGMGIDKADVRCVIHAQLPTTLEAYYQEAGRAGRDGNPARCIAFYARKDQRLGEGFINRTHPPLRRLRKLHSMLSRQSDELGRSDPTTAAIVALLGSQPEAWLSGEPDGPLAALERSGGIRRLVPASMTSGTHARSTGPLTHRVGVFRKLNLDAAGHRRRYAFAKLGAVEEFARTHECRRKVLLRYFGEITVEYCGRCDRCGWDFISGIPAVDG
jgi:ATP-dependent DNA helicase RecQ